MKQEEKHLHKIYRVGGRSFSVYLEYDEQMGESYLAYPDFEEHPEYTEEGRPFVTAVQESCPCAKARAPGEERPGDCSGCGWFFRENTPYDPIGICMCDTRRCKPGSLEE
jgi:hydrogenase maturation factor